MTDEEKQELCIACQKCCKLINIVLPPQVNKELLDYYKLRGFNVKEIGFGQFKGYFVIEINAPCVYLSEKGCSVYKDRHKMCREYDCRNDPAMMYEGLWTK